MTDSSALIYLVEAVPRRGAAVSAFLDHVKAVGGRPFASVLVMTELLERPLRMEDTDLALRYRRFLADPSSLVLVPVDSEVAETAAHLLAGDTLGPRTKPPPGTRPLDSVSPRHEVSFADAIHLATAFVHGADAILTNDEAWRDVPGVPAVFLVDELAAELE